MNKIQFENSIKLPDSVQLTDVQWQRVLLKFDKLHYEVREIIRESEPTLAAMDYRTTLRHHDVCTKVEIGYELEKPNANNTL